MGAASSGGSDNDVSGAEAVITGGTTYSSRKTKTVNKSIADQNRANRQSRKSPVTKLFEASLIGKGTKAISESHFYRTISLHHWRPEAWECPVPRLCEPQNSPAAINGFFCSLAS